MASMEIRDFIPEDWDEYVKMGYDMYSGDATLFRMDEQKLRDTFDLAVKGSDLMRGMMILADGKIVGYGLLAFYWSCEAGGFTVQAEELYFKEGCRDKGYGHYFFNWLFKEYPQAKRFRLEVCPQNPQAKKLYESLGFKDLDYIQMIKQ